MIKFFFIFSIVGFTHLMVSCSKQTDDPISQQQFTQILADLMIIDAYVIPDSLKTVKLDSVFKSNHISSAEFNLIRVKYQQNTQYWQSVYTNVEKNLKERRSQSIKSSGDQELPADSL